MNMHLPKNGMFNGFGGCDLLLERRGVRVATLLGFRYTIEPEHGRVTGLMHVGIQHKPIDDGFYCISMVGINEYGTVMTSGIGGVRLKTSNTEEGYTFYGPAIGVNGWVLQNETRPATLSSDEP